MHDPGDQSFQRLCHEAVLACGADDLDAIRRYVDSRLVAMSEGSRQQIARDIERVLAFMPPDRPTWEQ